jgi:predicted nucleic acid-binding protein
LVVSNTSPLVYLAALGDFALLPDLFSRIVIPRAVFQEIVVGGAGLPVARVVQGALSSWLSVTGIVSTSRASGFQQAGLHAGESEAIVLAIEVDSQALLMDDRDGVRAAVAAGINVIRTPGIYRLAKHRRMLPAVRPKLDEL